jgi:DNA polymerase-3 subunit gamma/tau
MLQVADDMATRSLSFDEALQELASLFTRLQVAQLAPQAIADDLPERARILNLAARLDPEFVQLGYQIAVHGRKELPLAPDEQSGFVMTLLRLHVFRPAQAGDAPRPRPPASAAKVAPLAPVVVPAKPVEVSPAPVFTPAAVIEPVAELLVPEPSVVESVAINPVAPLVQTDDWHAILDALKLGGMARELAQHCELRRVYGPQVVLCLSPTHRHLQMKPAQDKLQQSLSDYLGRSVNLTINLEEVAGETPAAAAQRNRDEKQNRAVASIEQDDFVREAIDLFDATLIESSIKPV